MTATMKALVKKYAEPGIWLQEVAIPSCGEDDVLIKIHKTAICGTDIHIYQWNKWAQETIKTPLVIGHEFVGEIVEVGRNVKGLNCGAVVSGEGHIVCGVCRNCLAGRRHLCRSTRGIGVNRDGCFAEYLALPASNAWLCNPKIAEELYSIFDPFGNATHTALSFDVIGEDVLITGAGPIGIMAALIVKQNGARHVVITDINPYRLALAKKLGISQAVDTRKKNLKDLQKELGMKEGFDVGLEMSGSNAALNDMLENLAMGAKIAMLGIQDSGTSVDWNKIVFSSFIIKGVYGREMYETWYKMETMIQAGLDISGIITHRFPLTAYQEAFDIMAAGNSGKIVLQW